MKANKKIESFTLPEILVVIVISAIVVGLTFSVLTLVQKHYRDIKQNYLVSNEIANLQQQLWLDFSRYRKISYDEKLQELHFTNSLDTVIYLFNDNRLFRESDSLILPVTASSFYFMGPEVNRGQIDALKLELGEEANTMLFIHKVNDARTYMNKDGN